MALEDFCTESFAWCLVNSPEFTTAFLKMVKEELRSNGKLKTKLDQFDGVPSIATQLSFSSSITGQEENDDEEPEEVERKRFDLVIESAVRLDFILVIETKVASDSGADQQISDYRNALEIHPRFVPFAEKYVVSLTPSISGLQSPDANLAWGIVQKLLNDCKVAPSLDLI